MPITNINNGALNLTVIYEMNSVFDLQYPVYRYLITLLAFT